MILLFIVLAIALFILVEALWVAFNAKPVPQPTIPRGTQTIGNGPPLRYVVMGDSTTIAQGGTYDKGFPTVTAQFLAQDHTVAWTNLGEGGARAADVAGKQLPEAVKLQPDVALVAVAANDVTHLTKLSSVKESLLATITGLRVSNPEVKIVLTGAPDMGSVPRFPQPLRWLAGERTKDLNAMIAALAKDQNIIFAPIAQKTGPEFRKHPEYFAADKFHPNVDGYNLWTPVIIEALRAPMH